MLTSLIQLLIDGLAGLASLANSLPGSPFYNISAVTLDNQLLAFIAWIIPFEAIISLLSSWGVAIGLWYVVKMPMRWAKLIQ